MVIFTLRNDKALLYVENSTAKAKIRSEEMESNFEKMLEVLKF